MVRRVKVDKTLVARLARTTDAYGRSTERWQGIHRDHVAELEQHLPDGSGISDMYVVVEESGADKIVLRWDYRHMCEYGTWLGYSHWRVSVRSTFLGLRFTDFQSDGVADVLRNPEHAEWEISCLEDYFAETLDYALSKEIPC
jgi:hypothetical protein